MISTSTPYKIGDVREDGYIFRGHTFPKNKSPVELWLSPQSYFRNRVYLALKNAKGRAKASGRSFDLTLDYLISIYPPNGKCPALGIDMEFGGGGGSNNYNSPSIDRIDNTRGYEVGNVVWISHKANTIKSNASLAELRSITDFYESITSG